MHSDNDILPAPPVIHEIERQNKKTAQLMWDWPPERVWKRLEHKPLSQKAMRRIKASTIRNSAVRFLFKYNFAQMLLGAFIAISVLALLTIFGVSVFLAENLTKDAALTSFMLIAGMFVMIIGLLKLQKSVPNEKDECILKDEYIDLMPDRVNALHLKLEAIATEIPDVFAIHICDWNGQVRFLSAMFHHNKQIYYLASWFPEEEQSASS